METVAANTTGPNNGVEDEAPSVRNYRYVLRAADADVAIRITTHALRTLPETDLQQVLDTIQREALVGLRLHANDSADMARLMVLGEHRKPGSLLSRLSPDVQRSLAERALAADLPPGLLDGYPAWDGKDREPAAEPAPAGSHASAGPDSETRYKIAKGKDLSFQNFINGHGGP